MIDLNRNELFKVLDAIKAYHKDYSVDSSVTKMLKNIEKKIKAEIKNIDFNRQP